MSILFERVYYANYHLQWNEFCPWLDNNTDHIAVSDNQLYLNLRAPKKLQE